MSIQTLNVDPVEIKQIFDGKNWKRVDTAYRAWIVFPDSPRTRIQVLVADLVGGGNDITMWPIEDLPPIRLELP